MPSLAVISQTHSIVRVSPHGKGGMMVMGTPSALVTIAAYDVESSLPSVLEKMPYDLVDEVVVVNDCSRDHTAEVARKFPVTVIDHPTNRGVGAVIKTGLRRALDRQCEVFVIMAGNGKDDPREIPRLLEAIHQGYDYVQGSRFVLGGRSENLPLFRRLMVPASAWLFRVLTGFPGKDALNGFRAYRLTLLSDPRINIWQDWLDQYELEMYIHYKALTLGYRVTEVPVTKSYRHLSKTRKYSHIRPIVDWWKIIRPIVYLSLRIKE